MKTNYMKSLLKRANQTDADPDAWLDIRMLIGLAQVEQLARIADALEAFTKKTDSDVK